MKVIWKYNLEDGDIYVPNNSQVLCVKLQNCQPHIWILRDLDEDGGEGLLQFEVIGTGQEFNDTSREYIGTYMDGPFVWHVFKVIK